MVSIQLPNRKSEKLYLWALVSLDHLPGREAILTGPHALVQGGAAALAPEGHNQSVIHNTTYPLCAFQAQPPYYLSGPI